jgi:hypothetical protein
LLESSFGVCAGCHVYFLYSKISGPEVILYFLKSSRRCAHSRTPNLPAWNSMIACCISACVFITKGP